MQYSVSVHIIFIRNSGVVIRVTAPATIAIPECFSTSVSNARC